MKTVLTSLLALTLLGSQTIPARAGELCTVWRVTGYNRFAGNAYTADETPVNTGEALAASSWLPFNARVSLYGLGTYRVADRIGSPLGPHHLDVMVSSDAEAYALTGDYDGCATW